MKVIAFNGSPHHDKGTALGISAMKEILETEGIVVEVVHVGNKTIQGCLDCRKCRELKRCAIDGDLVNESREKLKSADGIILGSPVYYSGIAGTFKCFLDRLFFTGVDLKYKAGATVLSVRRTGGIAAFHQLNNYFNLAQVIITPGIYWNVIHGRTEDEFAIDEEGRQIMEAQARNMAWLIKALAAGKKEVPLPEHPRRKLTNFIRMEGV
jgi:multimeric flavodoxin WrbA